MPEVSNRVGPVNRLLDWLFGYDYFLAHRSVDGKVYAEALHDALRAGGLDAFLDVKHYEAGRSLTAMQTRAIEKTTRLIIIVTPRAHDAAASYLLGEVREFKRRHPNGIVVPIGNLETMSRKKFPGSALLPELPNPGTDIFVVETPEKLDRGEPSAVVVAKLLNDFTERKRRMVRQRVMGAAASLILLLILSLGTLVVETRQAKARELADRHFASESDHNLAIQLLADAESDLDSSQVGEAVAHLARALQNDPSNRGAAKAAVEALAHPAFPRTPRFTFSNRAGVRSIHFSPDSRYLVVASDLDDSAQVWEVATGKPIGLPMKSDGMVTSANFSADGRWIVTASMDKTARVWDAMTGEPKFAPLKLDSWVGWAEFSQNGRSVLTGPPLRVWDAATGASVDTPIDASILTPKGNWLVTVSDDLEARLWEGPFRPVAEPPPATSLLEYVERTQKSVNEAIERSQREKTAFDVAREGAVLSPDRTMVLSGGHGQVQRWDAHTGKAIAPPLDCQDGSTPTHSIAQSPDGRWTLAAHGKTASLWDNTAFRVDSTAWKPDRRLVHAQPVAGARFSADGRLLVTWSSNVAKIWEVTTGEQIGGPLIHDAGDLMNQVRFSPDGRWIVTTSQHWETRNQKRRDGGFAIAEPRTSFDPKGRVKVWPTMPLAQHGDPVAGPGVSMVQFSPDGALIASATINEGAVQVWETASRALRFGPKTTTQSIVGIAFSSDGRHLTVQYGDSLTGLGPLSCQAWDLTGGQALFELQSWDKAVEHGFVSLQSQFATGSQKGLIPSPGIESGPAYFPGIFHSVRVSPDGKFLATVDQDKLASLWPVFLPQSPVHPSMAETLVALGGHRPRKDSVPLALPVEEQLALRESLWQRGKDNPERDTFLTWYLNPEPGWSRTINFHSSTTVPQLIEHRVSSRLETWQHRQFEDAEPLYRLDPGHPLVHVALALTERNPRTAAFLRRWGVENRLADPLNESLYGRDVWARYARLCGEMLTPEDPQLAQTALELAGKLEN